MKLKKLTLIPLILITGIGLSSCKFFSDVADIIKDDDEDEETSKTTTNILPTSADTTTNTDISTTTSTNTQTTTTTTIVTTYSVTFDPNGGEGTEIVNDDIDSGSTITLPNCSFTRSGYSFVSWYDGTNYYNPLDEYVVNSNTTFKAIWNNDDTYTITYVTGAGKNSSLNPVTYETLDDVELVDAEVPEGFYYQFDGWYTSLDFDDKVTNLYGHTGNLTLYAAYTKPLYWYDIEGIKEADKTVVNVEYSDGVIGRALNYALFYNIETLELNMANFSGSISSVVNSTEIVIGKNYYSYDWAPLGTKPGYNLCLKFTFDYGELGQEQETIEETDPNVQADFINFAPKDEVGHGLYNYLLSNTCIENIETSEQLYYALENGYNFTIKSGSVAEQVYNEATQALQIIIDKNMTEKEKVVAISAYLMNEVVYNTTLSELNLSGSDVNKYANTYYYRGHFASGALLDGYAVCDGYAKAFVIMAGIEGIKSRVARGYLGEVGGGHAWNKVFIDADGNGTKEWYALDLTNSDSSIGISSNKYDVSNYARILVTDYDLIHLNYIYRDNDLINKPSSSANQEQIAAAGTDLSNIKDLANTFFDLYDDTTFTYTELGVNKSYDFVVQNQSELNTIVSQTRSDILSSNIFVLSVECIGDPNDFSINSMSFGAYSIYSSIQKVYKEDGTSLNIKLFIFIKH